MLDSAMTSSATDPGKPRETVRYRHQRVSVELPTLLLIVIAYGGWLALTAAYDHWPLWIVAPAVVVVLALHNSLQHEIIHGHPTRWSRINRFLGMVPLSFWLPFDRYREHHLDHHVDERLTDPLDDTESYYWTPEEWARLTPIGRTLLQAQQTLAGRMVIGSFWRIGHFFRGELRALINNDKRVRAIWIEHLMWCVPVILWLTAVCHMPLWIYVVAMVLPANGLLLIRSFAEHRAQPESRHRTAIVERAWVLGPLFLFNNLHALHHESPAIPWYEYNARYRAERDRLIAKNGGLVYSTYFDVTRRFLFRRHDVTVHPTGRVPRPSRRVGAAPLMSAAQEAIPVVLADSPPTS
jgi:fatty acid desaturase